MESGSGPWTEVQLDPPPLQTWEQLRLTLVVCVSGAVYDWRNHWGFIRKTQTAAGSVLNLDTSLNKLYSNTNREMEWNTSGLMSEWCWSLRCLLWDSDRCSCLQFYRSGNEGPLLESKWKWRRDPTGSGDVWRRSKLTETCWTADWIN